MAIGSGDGSIILSTKVDTKGLKAGLRSIKTITKAVTAGFVAIAGAATTAAVAMTKSAVSAYAEFEQLSGGAELLFGEAYDYIIKKSEDAFATVQLSQNEYLKQVNGFAVGLKTALGGNEMAAAQLADKIINAEADVIAATGRAQEDVQNAFNGIMKSQYNMVDNLMIGITPTKEGYQEMIDKVNAWHEANGRATKYNMGNLADEQAALVDHIEMVGMKGYAEREASGTIEGSLAMTKSAWENLMIAMGRGDGIEKAINNLVFSLSKFVENIVPVVERSLVGIGQLISQAAPLLVETVARALIQAIPSLLTAVYQMIVGLAKGIRDGIKALLSGKTSEITAQLNDNMSAVASNTGSAADGMEELADETKKAGKEAKKSLAAFDDLQILADNSSAGSAAKTDIAGGGGGFGGGSGSGSQDDGSGMFDNSKFMEIANAIKSTIADILDAASKALLAVGLILLFTGNVLGGVGLILAGAAAYVAGDTLGSENPVETLKKHLETIEKYLVPGLLGLGILLLFFGMVPLGIGLIIAGVAYWGYKETKSKQYDTASFEDKLNVIMEAVSLGLVAIGVLLIFAGVMPLGIGLVIAGASLLNATEQKLDESGTQTKIQKFFEDNSALIVGVAIALIVIAIVLFATGVGTPIALGLLVAGGSALATAEIMNEGAIGQTITKFFQDNAGLIAGISIALVILGIILLFTGVGIPLAIGLIVAGGGALAATVALNWNFITDKIKEVWEKVKAFWNEHIAPIFTKEWWAELAKKAGNGIIEGFEGAINGIITMFEKMINWIVKGINKISFDIPDWLGGGHFGFNLPEVKFDRVSIPRLAKGAVIPANKEFLAVLGDQKQGVNIEAPLQTIVDAFNIALAQNGGGNSGSTTVVLEIDGREFGHAVIEQGQRENRRLGTRWVMA